MVFALPHVHILCLDHHTHQQDHNQSSVVVADFIKMGSCFNFASSARFAPWTPLALDLNVQGPKDRLVQNSTPSWGLVVFQEMVMNHYCCLLSCSSTLSRVCSQSLPHVFTLNHSLTCLYSKPCSGTKMMNPKVLKIEESTVKQLKQ